LERHKDSIFLLKIGTPLFCFLFGSMYREVYLNNTRGLSSQEFRETPWDISWV